MTYQEAVAYLGRTGRFGVKLGLERTRALLEELGHPESGKRGALIAGTNGKGSTAAFLESILRAAGLHTGMTPSPHLASYTERITLDSRPVSEEDFAAAVTGVRPHVETVTARLGAPTEFEILIAVAVSWLAPRADRLVVEVGMGGRLDSTNTLDLGVAIVTNVGLDHRQYLGETVEAIAAEKAGIIKRGNTVVTAAEGAALAVVEAAARQAQAPLWRLGHEIQLSFRWLGWDGSVLDIAGPGFRHRDLHVSLPGSFQAPNAALAVSAAQALGDASPAAVREGLASARWPGRLERLAPDVVVDGAHNPDGIRRLVGDLRRLESRRRIVLLFGVMADKELDAMLPELRRLEPGAAVFTAAASAGDRAVEPRRLTELWGGGQAVVPAAEALARARELAAPDGLVLACGSLYLVGEVRSLV